MSMSNNDGFSLADVAAVTGNGGGGWFGGGDGSFAMLILFLFAMMGGWNNGGWGGNGGGAMPYVIANNTDSEVQRGFDQQAVMTGIGGIQAALGTAEVSRANNVANILQAINNLSATQQNCCCENRAAIADLKYTVATEACADRNAISNGVRDIQDSLTSGFQTILTQMCNDKIDAKNERIAELQTQLNMATLRESQAQQTAQILANNEAQTTALERYLAPNPVPAYVVQNPNCCGAQSWGCGCGA